MDWVNRSIGDLQLTARVWRIRSLTGRIATWQVTGAREAGAEIKSFGLAPLRLPISPDIVTDWPLIACAPDCTAKIDA
jgi:hypothetical protein